MKKASRITIKVDGKAIRAKENDATVNIGGPSREGEMVNGDYVYGEEDQPSSVECTMPVTADISLAEMRNWVDVTVIAELDTGQSYVISGAVVTDTFELSGGETKLTLQGPPAEEMR